MNSPLPASGSGAGNGRRRKLALGGAALIALGVLAVWLHGRGIESTEDAFVQSDIVMIAPRISGTVLTVAATDNTAVHAGDLLVELDPADAQVQLAQARASLRALEAEADRTQLEVKRYRALYTRDEVSRQLLDQTAANARALAAHVDEAKAALDQAQLNLSYTRVLAPSDGIVTKKNVQVGAQVQAGAPLLALVGGAPWVVANFKETQLTRMQAGQPVTLKIDAYPGVVFHGRVHSLQSGTGSVFSLLPPENATGNFVKVVQRVPVKIVFDPAPAADYPLVPGMSVVAKVDTAAAPAASTVSRN